MLITLRVTKAEAYQLFSYAAHRDICGDGAGWYYGNKAQFQKRHESILEILQRAIDKADAGGVVP